nr:MAG TPA: hypothetical protein [Caudoviricetes sp.]
MMEDSLKRLVRVQRRKYRIISRAEEIQKVIDSIECLHNCSIDVQDHNFPQRTVDANVTIGRCDNDCVDENDVCKDIIEALELVKGKYIKAFEELDAETKKWGEYEKNSCISE